MAEIASERSSLRLWNWRTLNEDIFVVRRPWPSSCSAGEGVEAPRRNPIQLLSKMHWAFAISSLFEEWKWKFKYIQRSLTLTTDHLACILIVSTWGHGDSEWHFRWAGNLRATSAWMYARWDPVTDPHIVMRPGAKGCQRFWKASWKWSQRSSKKLKKGSLEALERRTSRKESAAARCSSAKKSFEFRKSFNVSWAFWRTWKRSPKKDFKTLFWGSQAVPHRLLWAAVLPEGNPHYSGERFTELLRAVTARSACHGWCAMRATEWTASSKSRLEPRVSLTFRAFRMMGKGDLKYESELRKAEDENSDVIRQLYILVQSFSY